MKSYYGYRDLDAGRCVVVIQGEDGEPRDLDPRLDVRNHSPDGFEWGYGGSGPAQLAFALLADALGDDELAEDLYQKFKRQEITKLGAEWRFTDAMIQDWAARQPARVRPFELPPEPAA